ncbi:fungal trichothecene efflux pump [Patellaria atrata CBS 101060]|uniref:Fungal trichothecene efflux pump n=1 Tax=Patellaria atrata CBS 101060 TaxID=1346257 RepID=A0A9P4VM55_9PEZI|nr:fungal trichothecene efflux pump [Patellaria atrata CBS 101060]
MTDRNETINAAEFETPGLIEKVDYKHTGHHDHVAQEAIGGLTQNMPPGYYHSPRFIGTLVATCLAQISGYLGWVLPANTLTLINAAIGPSPNIIWVAISWTAGFTVGFTLVGRLSDIFGRRWFFIGASVLAVIGNIIGAAAQNINMLIATNCINGLAAAGQLSFNVVLGELVSNKARGPFNAIVLSTSIPFAVFGPPVARALYENTDLQWRWSYILGVIVNVIAVVLYYFFYHPPTYEMLHVGGKSKLRQLKSLDWIGIFLFTSGLVVFLIGINWGGGIYPWKSAHVLGAFFAGFATLVIFCFWEKHCGLDYPLIPMGVFKNIKYDSIVACASIGAIVYYSMTVIWPTMIGALFTTDIQEIGWLSCAVGGGLLFGQIMGGIGVRYIPRMKIQMTVASIIMVAFVAALASSTEHTRGRTVAFLLIGTASAGYIENLTLSTMALVWPPEDIGLVAGVMGAIRTGLSTIATSMYSSILATELAKNLPKFVPTAAIGAGLSESAVPALMSGVAVGNFTLVPGFTEQIGLAVGEATKRAYVSSFRVVFLCTLPFGAIILVAALISPNVEDYLTDDVARRLQDHGGEKGVVSKQIEEAE